MNTRPQFSLRTVLFITAVVALVAATAAPLVPARSLGDGWGWEELGFAIHAQAALRLVACLLLPSMCAAGAVAANGDMRAFCFGSLLPAATPLLLIWHDAANPAMFDFLSAANTAGVIQELQMAAWGWTEGITTLWTLTPCIGLLGVSLRWWLRHGVNGATPGQRDWKARLLVIASMLICIWAAMLLLPPSRFRVTFFVLAMIRVALCVLVPSLLAVGIAETRGAVRAFLAGGMLPALLPLFFLGSAGGRIYDWRGYIAMMWALIPLFGTACVFFHWLFQRDEPEAKQE